LNYIEWVHRWESGRKWFARLEAKKGSPETTLQSYAIGLYFFAEFKQKDPDTLITEYKAAAGNFLDDTLDQIETDLDLFMNFLVTTRNIKRSSAGVYHTAIQSWLRHNAKSLRGLPTPKTYSETIPPIKMEDLKEVLREMDARETAFTMILKDTGMSRAEAVKLTWGQIKEDFERGEQYVHLAVRRQKEHVDYDTFFGPNAVEALKTYLRQRQEAGEKLKDTTPIFAARGAAGIGLGVNGLGELYIRLTDKTGIKITTHRLRKFFETYMALEVRHPLILKYWMGHKVKSGKSDIEGRYIIPPVPEQKKLYIGAYKAIDLSPKPDENALLVAEFKARAAGMTPEEKRRFIEAISLRHRSLLDNPEIQKLLDEKQTNGGVQFEEINEADLLGYLNRGYTFVHALQNGRVIVKSPS